MITFKTFYKKIKAKVPGTAEYSSADAKASRNDAFSRDTISWEEKERAKERKQLQKDAAKRNQR